MTAIDYVLICQTIALVVLLVKAWRLQSQLDLLDLTVGAIEREVELLHVKLNRAPAD